MRSTPAMSCLSSIFLSVILMSFLSACNNKGAGSGDGTEAAPAELAPSKVTYEEAKMTIAEEEANDPLRFLRADGEYRPALLGGDFKIMGYIESSASEVTYKDVVVEFTYSSKTQSVTGTERKIFYEYIKPGSRFNFEFKVDVPGGTETIGWKVVEARVD